MSEICRIKVPIDPAPMSANKRKHWSQMSRLKANAWQTARACWIEAGKPVASGQVIVHITARRARALDYDNLLSGCKALFDGLFVNAITADDSPKYLRIGHIEQIIKPEYKAAPSVEFIVETLE
jgi:hypothetical protein